VKKLAITQQTLLIDGNGIDTGYYRDLCIDDWVKRTEMKINSLAVYNCTSHLIIFPKSRALFTKVGYGLEEGDPPSVGTCSSFVLLPLLLT
jgi:hypothetical protein